MAHTRGFTRPVRPGSLRKKKTWFEGPGDQTFTSLTASGSAILGAGLSVNVGSTLLRTRGELSLFIVSVTTDADAMIGAFGIGMASIEAFAAGIGSVLKPLEHIDSSNWLYHTMFNVQALGTESTNIGNRARFIEIDSKAMRKQDTDLVIYAAIEVVEVGAVTMSVGFQSRMLFTLP